MAGFQTREGLPAWAGRALLPALLTAAALAALAFTVSAYAVSPLLFPVVTLGALFVAAAFYRPAWGLAGAFLTLPLERVAAALPGGGLSPTEAGLAVVALAWVARAALRPHSVRLPSLRDVPVIVLLGAFAAGLAFAVDPSPILRVLVFWALFYLIFLQVQTLTPGEMRLVLIALVISTGILGSLGAITYLRSGNTQLFQGGTGTGARAAGGLLDPNYYASLLLLGILPGCALLLGGFRRNWLLLFPLLGGLAGVVFSLSRGAVAGLAVGLLVLLIWGRARWVAAALVVVFAVLTLANANPVLKSDQFGVIQERLGTLNSSLTTTDRRPEIWATALAVTAEHPFFGVGVKQFQAAAGERGLVERGDPLENVHNLPLNIAAENGLVGLAAFLVFSAQVLVRSIRAVRVRDPLRYSLAIGLLSALVAFAVQGLTQAQLRVNVIAAVFFVLCGMATALADRARRDEPPLAGAAS